MIGKLNRIKSLFLLAIVTTLIVSCSEKTITPSEPEVNIESCEKCHINYDLLKRLNKAMLVDQ